MPLSLRFQLERGTPVLNVAGDLDLDTAGLLRDACVDLTRVGHRDLVLDLDNVALVDSFALGVLVSALNRARALGGNLRLVCNQGHIRKVLAVTGLDRVFSVHDSRDAVGLTPVPTDPAAGDAPLPDA